jgi:hypothetical protein
MHPKLCLIQCHSTLTPFPVEAIEKDGSMNFAAARQDAEDAIAPIFSAYSQAEKYARNVDIMGSFENLMVHGALTEPKPLR